MKKKNVIILAIAMIIVIAGVIVASTIGFNKQLRYQDSQKIDIYVASEVDVDKIKSEAKTAFRWTAAACSDCPCACDGTRYHVI